ncbi:lamin tail domain-containing protein [bacterium]|nr:lamin tail domain-containing protein [bacterium]
MLLNLAIWILFIVCTAPIASSDGGCAGGGASWSSSCDEYGWTCEGAFCGIEAGEKRLGMGVLTPTDSGMMVFDVRVTIESNEVVLKRDTVVTSYFQTEPFYRDQLRSNDTWTGFSSPGPVYVSHPLLVNFYTVSIYEGMVDPETSSMVFAFVPHTYSDSADIRDSMQSNFHMRDAPGYPYRKIVQNDLLATSAGHHVSPPPFIIPSDPPGETFPQILYPAPGDLIITEIMKDPNNGVSDATGEWFEVLNATDSWLDMGQLVIRDQGSDFFAAFTYNNREDALLVAPRGTFVFGKTRDARLNGGAKVDAAYGDAITLSNTSDEIILEVSGVGEIDRVEYNTTAWPNPSGKSMMLTDTAADNNDGSNWTASTLVYGNKNQKGTPNSPNTVPSDTPVIPEPGTGAAAGSLVITEFLANAIGLDQNGEWFEIFNRTDSPVTLTDLTFELEDSTGITSSFTVNTETVLDPNTYFVFARDAATSPSGFSFDYDYPNNISLSNDKGVIRIKDDTGTVIDEVSYDGNLFQGSPDYGNGIDGGWPVASEFDGRSAALQGSLSDLRNPNYDNTDKNNWAFASNLERYGSGGTFKGRGAFGTAGRPNVFDLSLTVSMPASIDANTTAETFSVTITPPAGFGVDDIDTQSIRIFRIQRPIFLKINATTLRADFRSFEAPPTVDRNKSVTAEVTALRNSDTPQAFLGSATMTVNDNRVPTPGDIGAAAAGDLLITEVMVNGPGDENLTEYFEVLNQSNKTIDLAALGIQDGGGTTGDATPEAQSRIYNPNGPYPLRIEPGQYKVIGRAGNRIQVGGYDLDGIYMNQDLNFSNSGDEVVVFRLSDNVVIAQMEFSTALGFPAQDAVAAEGRSLSLVDTTADATHGENWVNAAIPYGDSGYGTPGDPNRIAYKSGHVLVSEVYANPPPGGEPNAEFFEVVNPDTANPIDLSGLIVSDDNGNTFAIDDYPGKIVSGGKQKVHIPAGAAFVFGNSRGAADGVDNTFDDTFGAGVTSYDYPNSWTLLNTSPGDAVRLIRHFSGGDSAEIHGMTYSSAPEGNSWELDTLSDSLTYSLKTPSPTIKP